MKKLLFILLTIGLLSCTSNQRARNWGGKEELVLQPHHVLLGCTFKDHDLWILTRDTSTNICYFREKSSWGIWNGQITFK